MLANGGNTEGLFRGAFMQSGSMTPLVKDIDNAQDQRLFDTLANQVGCSNTSDILECLRRVPFSQYQTAIDASPGIFALQVIISDS